MNSIPGVLLRCYRHDELLQPDAQDGFLGKLYSCPVILEAVVQPGEPVVVMFQQGVDKYWSAKDWMKLATVPANASPLVSGRWWYTTGPTWHAANAGSFAEGTAVYRHKVEVDANKTTGNSFSPYPANVLVIARYVPGDAGFTNLVRIWKVALVSQRDDQFFFSVQQVYDTAAYRNDEGAPCYPRLAPHPTLQELLVQRMPQGIMLPSESEYRDPAGPALQHLRTNQGLVTNWYEARGMGVLMTKQGEARVYWRDVPGRPRKAFLMPGEVVGFKKLDKSTLGEKTRYRKQPRRSGIELQAYGITVAG